MGEAQHRTMAIKTVILEFTRVRLIVADLEPLSLEMLDHRSRESRITIPKNTDLPGSCPTFPNGRKAMNRNDDGNSIPTLHLHDFARDGVMVRRMKQIDSPLHLGGVDICIARNDAAVGKFHDERRIV